MRLPSLLLAALAWVTTGAATPEPVPALFPTLEQATVRATTASGVHDFAVWIADDDRSRQRGLMYVRALPADRGMLFLFERPQELAFWMKDTFVSLDLVFIDASGRVLNVAANAPPFSLVPIRSQGEALAVLEVVAGTARRIGLSPGDTVTLPTLRTTGPRKSPTPRSGRRHSP